MVKELTMDNSIFSLGANADSNLSANDASVANEFQAAFETAKNNYADQKEFSNDTQKVAKAAEKTLEIEKELNQKTEQTEVYKKVSTNTKTKSPQTLDIDTTSQTHAEADVNGVSDTYSFTIKQAVNGEQEAAPKAEQEVELTSENSNTIDENISNDEFVIENNTSSSESTETNAQTIAAEIVNFVAEKVTNVSTSTNDDESEESKKETSTTLLNTLTTETTENILNLTLQTTNETVEEVIVLTEETNLDIALESAVADTETVEENFTGAADIEVEVQTENKSIELGEGWEIIDTESQQPLTKEELKNLVSNNTKEVDLKTNETVLNADTKDLAPMDELNVKDVKPHTLEEIEAGKNQNEVEAKLNVETNPEIEIETKAESNVKVEAKAETTLDTISTEEIEIETETSSIEFNTSEKNVSNNTNVETMPEDKKPLVQENSNIIVEENIESTEQIKVEKVDTAEIIESTIDEVADDLKVKTETTKIIETEVESEIVEESVKPILTTEENTTTSNDDEPTSFKEETLITSTKEVKKEELDLDKLINNGIKLAFVDTTNTAKESETIDIISALESKFAENTEVETEVQFTNNVEIVEENTDVQEQIVSLDEVVNIAEFEELNVQLKDNYSRTSEKATTKTNTVNSTTEQLIRFSIEGETGYEPNAEFTTFRTDSPIASQQQTPQSSAKEVLAQLSEKLSTFSLKAGSKLTMQLSPENLGKIEIKLTNTAQGIIAEMTVSSDETCDMMKKNLDDLKDTLQKYGVRFDNVTVKTTATQQSANQQDYTEQNNHQKQQQEQSRDNEKQKNKSNSFEDMMNSFTNEGIEE